MYDAVPKRIEGDTDEMHETLGDVTLGVVNTMTSYETGIWKDDDFLVAYTGFVPQWKDFFQREGLGGEGNAERVVSLYRREKMDFLKRLPGFFSIALYDRKASRVIIAGDRSGYFPLYYAALEDVFIFASTIKAVKPFVDPIVVNRGACIEHLLFDAVYGRQTYYEDIDVTPFGTCVVYDLNERKIFPERYFAYEELFDISRYRSSREIDAPRELSKKLILTLERIISSVDPASLALSCGGGIDCTYIGALIKEMGVELPIFCSNVVGSSVSEYELAEEAAKRIGSRLYVSDLKKEDFYPLILKSILDYEQPIVHPSTPKFYVSTGVKWETGRRNQIMGVASDLLFGGIGNVRSLYRYIRMRGLLRFVPSRFRRVLSSVFSEPGVTNVELRMRNKLRDLARVGMGNLERASMQERVERILSAIPSNLEREVKILMVENLCDYQQHLLNRRYESNTSYGISLFFPFLDREVLEFAVNLPVSHCVDWKNGKVVVRRAAAHYLGSSFYSRKKWGGDVPIDKWIPPLKFLLKDGFIREFFSFEFDILSDALDGSIKVLWNLLDLELWGRLSVMGESPYDLIELMRVNGIDCSDYVED